MRALPNLIIIGGHKCGTTSLHYYLGLHPDIFMSRTKELNFFTEGSNWSKGTDWYMSNFDGRVQVRGEASPRYTKYPQWRGVPERIHSVIRQTKLIYLVRNPVDRIISHYTHQVARGVEQRGIGKVLSGPDGTAYIDTCRYWMQIQQYLKFFPDRSILVVATEDLRNRRHETLKRIFDFLEVNESYRPIRSAFMWHKSRFKRRRTRFSKFVEDKILKKSIARLPWETRGVIEKLVTLPITRRVERPELDGEPSPTHCRRTSRRYCGAESVFRPDTERMGTIARFFTNHACATFKSLYTGCNAAATSGVSPIAAVRMNL